MTQHVVMTVPDDAPRSGHRTCSSSIENRHQTKLSSPTVSSAKRSSNLFVIDCKSSSNEVCHHLRCHPLRGHRNCVASSRRVITYGVISFAVYLQYVQLPIPKEPSFISFSMVRFHLHARPVVLHRRIVRVLWK